MQSIPSCAIWKCWFHAKCLVLIQWFWGSPYAVPLAIHLAPNTDPLSPNQRTGDQQPAGATGLPTSHSPNLVSLIFWNQIHLNIDSFSQYAPLDCLMSVTRSKVWDELHRMLSRPTIFFIIIYLCFHYLFIYFVFFMDIKLAISLMMSTTICLKCETNYMMLLTTCWLT